MHLAAGPGKHLQALDMREHVLEILRPTQVSACEHRSLALSFSNMIRKCNKTVTVRHYRYLKIYLTENNAKCNRKNARSTSLLYRK
jgi:hypothetical protein